MIKDKGEVKNEKMVNIIINTFTSACSCCLWNMLRKKARILLAKILEMKEAETTKLVVGASNVPHAEILEEAATVVRRKRN